jgi:tetratricopeptide (TPR) repeat protein
MEKLFSEEELRAIVDETLNAEYTLEEVIAQREEDLKILEESFQVTEENIRNVKATRKNAARVLRRARIHIELLKLLSMVLVNEDALFELKQLIEQLKLSKQALDKDQETLTDIEIAYYRLKKLNTADLNYDICDILQKLFEKSVEIYKQTIKQMNMSATRMNGINVIAGDSKKVEELDSYIDGRMLTLGLNKKS